MQEETLKQLGASQRAAAAAADLARTPQPGAVTLHACSRPSRGPTRANPGQPAQVAAREAQLRGAEAAAERARGGLETALADASSRAARAEAEADALRHEVYRLRGVAEVRCLAAGGWGVLVAPRVRRRFALRRAGCGSPSVLGGPGSLRLSIARSAGFTTHADPWAAWPRAWHRACAGAGVAERGGQERPRQGKSAAGVCSACRRGARQRAV